MIDTDTIWLIVAVLLFMASGGTFGYLYALHSVDKRSNVTNNNVNTGSGSTGPWAAWVESGRGQDD